MFNTTITKPLCKQNHHNLCFYGCSIIYIHSVVSFSAWNFTYTSFEVQKTRIFLSNFVIKRQFKWYNVLFCWDNTPKNRYSFLLSLWSIKFWYSTLVQYFKYLWTFNGAIKRVVLLSSSIDEFLNLKFLK